MTIIFTLAVITALVIAWVTYLRPWLRDKEWAKGFFAAIEPFELWVYSKSESILWARWQQFLGLVLTITGLFGGIDWTALAILTPDWIDPILPAIPLILNITGTIAERLRNDTTKSIEQVAIPENAPVEVRAAAIKQEIAVVEVKEAVAEAKAEGAM